MDILAILVLWFFYIFYKAKKTSVLYVYWSTCFYIFFSQWSMKVKCLKYFHGFHYGQVYKCHCCFCCCRCCYYPYLLLISPMSVNFYLCIFNWCFIVRFRLPASAVSTKSVETFNTNTSVLYVRFHNGEYKITIKNVTEYRTKANPTKTKQLLSF